MGFVRFQCGELHIKRLLINKDVFDSGRRSSSENRTIVQVNSAAKSRLYGYADQAGRSAEGLTH